MYHPLFIDPVKLKDADIDAKILDLSKKYNMASRMGNIDLCGQIALIIEELKVEMAERHANRIKQPVNNKNLEKLIKTD
jgi:hypothetical protein